MEGGCVTGVYFEVIIRVEVMGRWVVDRVVIIGIRVVDWVVLTDGRVTVCGWKDGNVINEDD